MNDNIIETTISTITPVYCGEIYLEELVLRLEKLINFLELQNSTVRIRECIFVIDECIDDSHQKLINVAKDRSWIKILELSKNFGQHPATTAGILHSSGDWIVTLDEDLQHDPKYILEMLEATVERSSDICYGKATSKTHNSFVRDKVSMLFKKILTKLTDNKNLKDFSSFRIIRGSIARASASISGFETYYDIALGWFTHRVVAKEIIMTDQRNATDGGQSGYSVLGLFKHGKRMIMTSKIKLLRIGILIGVFSFLLSLFLTGYGVAYRLLSVDVASARGWASNFVVTLFFGGLSSLLIGIVLETVSDLLISAKGKPNYFVVNRDSDKQVYEELKKMNAKK